MCNYSVDWRLSPGRVDKLRRAAVTPPRRGLTRYQSDEEAEAAREAPPPPAAGRVASTRLRDRCETGLGVRRGAEKDVNVALNLEC